MFESNGFRKSSCSGHFPLRLLVAAAVLFVIQGCGSHYKISESKVEYISWDSGRGTHAELVTDADPQTFTQISDNYGIDATSVFWQQYRIEFAARNSFEVIDDLRYHAKDKDHAFKSDRVLEGSHAPSFEFLSNGWSRDKKSYFYGSERADVCDYPTFRLTDDPVGWGAIDSECYYWRGERVDVADFETFRVFPDSSYAVDSAQVYWGDMKLTEADASTFEVVESGRMKLGRDENSCFFGSRRVECEDLSEEARSLCPCSG